MANSLEAEANELMAKAISEGGAPAVAELLTAAFQRDGGAEGALEAIKACLPQLLACVPVAPPPAPTLAEEMAQAIDEAVEDFRAKTTETVEEESSSPGTVSVVSSPGDGGVRAPSRSRRKQATPRALSASVGAPEPRPASPSVEGGYLDGALGQAAIRFALGRDFRPEDTPRSRSVYAGSRRSNVYSCGRCTAEFKNADAIRKHLRTAHGLGTPAGHCCGLRTESSEAMRLHLKTTHGWKYRN